MRLALVAVLISAALPAMADDQSKRAKIAELLEVMNARASVDQMLKVVSDSARQGAAQSAAQAGAGADAGKLSEEIVTVITDAVRRQLGWEDFFKPELTRIYADSFEESDIDAILTFYRSPAGRRLVAKLPVLMQQGAQLGQQRMQAMVPEIQRIIAEKIEKYKKEHAKQP